LEGGGFSIDGQVNGHLAEHVYHGGINFIRVSMGPVKTKLQARDRCDHLRPMGKYHLPNSLEVLFNIITSYNGVQIPVQSASQFSEDYNLIPFWTQWTQEKQDSTGQNPDIFALSDRGDHEIGVSSSQFFADIRHIHNKKVRAQFKEGLPVVCVSEDLSGQP